jgi:membrane associated rhomboid family serine protease
MFIPLGDDNAARRTRPFVVYGLILVNALVWLLQMTMGDAFTMGFSTVPYEITNGTDLVGLKRVAVDGQSIALRHYPGPEPIYLTLLTSMFMHGSWMHIIGNMMYLWIFGDQIEDRLGRGKFLLFYVLCGLAAGLAQVLFQPKSIIPALGASGAIAGVLGAYLVRHPRNQVRVLFINRIVALPALVVLGGWILLQVISQVSVVPGAGGVAYMAHIGGFVAGMILILLFDRTRSVAGGAPGRLART